MKSRLFLLCAIVFSFAVPGQAERAENAQAVLRSTAMACGTAMESAAAIQSTSMADLSSPGESVAVLASFFGGLLIPALDNGGLITTARIIDYLLSRNLTLDPLTADFFGNGDGKLDVADTVTQINRRP